MNTMETAVAEKTGMPGFDEEAFARLQDHQGAGPFGDARKRAFEAFLNLPVPSRKIEEWRRTDPSGFPFARTTRMPDIKPVDAGGTGDFDVVVTVNQEGLSVQDVSGVLKQGGLTVMPFEMALQKHPDLMATVLAQSDYTGGMGKFESMNHAFSNLDLFIRLPPGLVLEKGILIRCELKSQGQVFVPRLAVRMGEGSRAVIAEHMVSDDEDLMMSVMTQDIRLEPDARLKMAVLQEWGSRSYTLSSDRVWVGRGGRLDWLALNLGSRLGKMNFSGDVGGEGAEAEFDGLFFADEEQHLDQKTLQIHSAPNTFSNLLYKGAVKDEAYSIYQGLIIAREGASKVDAYQKNNNLVLNDGARADSLPGLEIDTDDLKCSHGSTIGNLDDEEVFYLQSRGLDKKEARKILIQGFFEEIIGKIPYDFMKDRVRHRVEEKMK
ncbi:MAG: Fe-S cluster assembly protein SufD [Lentisphaerota bacterium]